MDKDNYSLLFREAVRRALLEAGIVPVGEPVIEFHGMPNPSHPITMDEATDFLWISPERFFRIVDVAAMISDDDPPHMFVRISGHEPGGYADTWGPADLGPFKVMGPGTRGREPSVR
jgi:hypothetical protein